MPKDTSREEVYEFIKKYFEKNGVTPKLMEWKVKDGFPCNKEKVLSIFGKYNDLLDSLGYETFTYGQRRYNKKKLLEELRSAVLQHRSVDFRIIRDDNNLKHRDIYTSQFGSVRNALQGLGINNNNIFLMKEYGDYKLEDPREFLIKKMFDGSLEEEPRILVEYGRELLEKGYPFTRDSVAEKLSIRKIYKHFKKFPYYVIICGGECKLGNKQQYRSQDGHLCDSYEESLIDDLLYSKKIKHKTQTFYPGSKKRCDFSIGNVFIEYTGFMKFGKEKSSKYRKTMETKRKICKSNGIILIEVDDVKKDTLDKFLQRLYSAMNIEEPCELLEVP